MLRRRSSLLLLVAGSLAAAQKCSLTVTIVSGDIACSADNGCGNDPRRFLSGSKPDGYVTAKLGAKTIATPTVDDNETPEWDAKLDFECPYDIKGVNAATHLVLTMMDSDGGLRGDDEQMLQCDLGTAWRNDGNNGQVQHCQNDKNSLTYSIDYEYEEEAPTPAPVADAPTPAPVGEPAAKPTPKPTLKPTAKNNPKTTNAPVMAPTPAPVASAPTGPSDDDLSPSTAGAVMAQLSFGQPDCLAGGVEVFATGESLTATGVTGYVDSQGGCGADFNAVLGAECSSVTAYDWSFSLPLTSGGAGESTYSISSVEDCGIGSSGRRRLGSSHGRALATAGGDRMSWKEGAVLCNDGNSFVALVKDSDNDGTYGMTFATSDSMGFESATKGIPKVTGDFCDSDLFSVMDLILSEGPDAVIEDNGVKYTSPDTNDSGSSSGSSFTSGENLMIIVGSVLGAALLTSCVVYKVRSNKKQRTAAAAAAANADARGFYGGNGGGKTVVPVNATPAPLQTAPVAAAPAATARPPSNRASVHQEVEDEYLSSADPSPEPSPAPQSGVKSSAAPVVAISAAAAVGATAAAELQRDWESASERSEEEEEEPTADAENSYSYSNSYDQQHAAGFAAVPPAPALTPVTIPAGSQPRGTPARPSSGRGSPSNFSSTGSYRGQRGNNNSYPTLELGSSNGGRPYDSNVSDGFWGNDEPLSPAESSPQPRRKRTSAMDRLRAFP